MKILAIDELGDWTLETKQNIYAVEQLLLNNLRCYKNDCFFDVDFGISWNNYDIGQLNNLILEIKNIILSTNGISKLIDFNYFINDSRQLKINFSVLTIYSNQTLNIATQI